MGMTKADPATIDKAVELWKDMLRRPKFDNGDPSRAGGLATIMAAMIPTNTDDARLEAFGVSLKRKLEIPSRNGYYESILGVDYGPDAILAGAAREAGLDCQFPWKTVMWIEDGHVSVRNGYGAPIVHHYLEPDGTWTATLDRREEAKSPAEPS
jgi:hypothetical protein